MKKNAIILAAGKSNRFAPFTYEKPKGLFEVKGKRLIERQIEQLLEAGIKQIFVVVGFMKEKFFYLEGKYGVTLLINNKFELKGNLYSLYIAREYLNNSYVCYADQYFVENPFDKKESMSYRACGYQRGEFKEFGVTISDADVITSVSIGGKDRYCMIGHAFFTNSFSKKIIELMEAEINDFRVSDMFWEEFFAKHNQELTLYAKKYEDRKILEFDSVEELGQFDQEFLRNIDSEIVKNICQVLTCKPVEIKEIEVIQKGLTNVSFRFSVNGQRYVYRHPGGTSGNLVNRETECYVQYKAGEVGIDRSIIFIDPSGWKISYYVENLIPCRLEEEDEQLEKAMQYLRTLHQMNLPREVSLKQFDTIEEANRLMRIASVTKGNLALEFQELSEKIKKLNKYVKEDGAKQVICHNDVYAPNYLVTAEGELYLIDWEYAGINDPANDLGCIFCRADFSMKQIERFLRSYFGRELSWEEHRHYIAYIALSGYYWFCWGLYKGSVNDDDGFFFLPAYRNCIRFVDQALASYEKEY